jgi:glyoxylate/hydroxypyruvate reductase
MKKTSVLINTSRGGIVNHDDLYTALTTNQISAAGLDVTEPEPLKSDHPLVLLPNCVVLPHMGTNTTEAQNSMCINTANNILAVLDLAD